MANQQIKFDFPFDVIDEQSDFEDVVIEGFNNTVTIDLSHVKSINSVGIRSWISWIEYEAKRNKIILQNMSVCLVMQANMVDNFIPANVNVESFQAPFYCEKCDYELIKPLKIGVDITFDYNEIVERYQLKPSCKNNHIKCELELEARKEKYFKFLVQMIKRLTTQNEKN